MILTVILFNFALAAEDLESYRSELEAARSSYDAARAEAAMHMIKAQVEDDSTPEGKWLLAEAALAAAELHRLDYERNDLRFAQRRDLGDRIDEAAKLGHDILEGLEDTSEKYRMTADLWGTMIRSDFRGKRYGDKMQRAADKALELDPKNPDAYVTVCKRALYAPQKRGGDLDLALEYLEKALDLDPDHQAALILRGIAHERRGEIDAAVADWRNVLQLNPSSIPAKDNLERVLKDRSNA